VSIHGALLLTAVPIEEGQKLLLMIEVTQRQQICRIVYTRSRDMRQLEIAVEFPVPHGKFWRCPPAHDGELRSAENRRFLRVILPDRIMLTWKTSRQHVISRPDSLSPGGLFVNAQRPHQRAISSTFASKFLRLRAWARHCPPFAQGQKHGRSVHVHESGGASPSCPFAAQIAHLKPKNLRSKFEGRLPSCGLRHAYRIERSFCLSQLWHRMGGRVNQAMVTKEAQGRDATGPSLIPI
jgi:hypothetical protein